MRMLVVGGGAGSRGALARAVRQVAQGADVVVCEDAAEALSRPDAAEADTAFVDIGISGGSGGGVGLARELKRLNPRMNIVFATDGDVPAGAAARGRLLLKPVTAGDVAVALEASCRPVPPPARPGRLAVRCFGQFEAFADGRAVGFRRAKARELLAFLVDREGAEAPLREVEAALWEGGSRAGRVSGSYLRTLVAELRRALVSCGHGDVLVKRYGKLGLDAAKLDCDYYGFLAGDPLAICAWRGEYMTGYPWAESTRAALLR